MPSSFARPRVLALVFALLAATAAHAATSVIVELTKEPAAMAVARARAKGTPLTPAQVESYRSTLATAQQQFLARLAANGIAYQIGGTTLNNVRIDYRYTLVLNGINLLVDPSAIARIQAMPEVKTVHEDKVFRTLLDVSVPYIRAPQVYGAIKELTRFDTAHEGYEGQGIYVSIIDSGVEWHHEMFGNDPTPPRLGVLPPTATGTNEKVVYYLPLSDVVVEDGLGHGTHVASTVAGYQGFTPGPDGIPLNADDVKVHGVAPQARIMSYKVCSDAVSIPGALTGAVGGCVESVIVMGIEDSVSPRTVNGFPKPVANVINMSLGGSGGPDDVTSIASDNAVRLGTIVVAAAGNSGPGESTVGSPCAGRLVTCVANSIDPAGSWSFDVLAPTSVNRLLPGAVKPASGLAAASNQRSRVQLIPMAGTPDPPAGSVAQYYVYVADGSSPATMPASVSGRIALVGTTTAFAQAANSAAAAGAIGCILRSATANPTAVKA
ncbi:MAG TPA: S8 family serine peptidase, partial [Thermoanaerobaculia bacterium]|nr:S8 family serine peptidase [Thermoanaerobaculia bacterium]